MISRPRHRGRYFTQEEEQYIIENYDELSEVEMGKELKRRPKTIADKIYRMKRDNKI